MKKNVSDRNSVPFITIKAPNVWSVLDKVDTEELVEFYDFSDKWIQVNPAKYLNDAMVSDHGNKF